jgi:hypothetical protein
MFHVFGAGETARRSLSILILTSLLAACSALGPPPSAPPVGTHAPAATLPPAWTPTGRAGFSQAPSPSPAEETEAPTPTPLLFHVASAERARRALDTSSARILNDIMAPDFSLSLLAPEPLLWAGGWCAASQEILDQNLTVMDTLLFASGFLIDPNLYITSDYGGAEPEGPSFCRRTFVLIDSWPEGMTFLEVRHVIYEPLSDGWDEYQPDTLVARFVVYIGSPFQAGEGPPEIGRAAEWRFAVARPPEHLDWRVRIADAPRAASG